MSDRGTEWVHVALSPDAQVAMGLPAVAWPIPGAELTDVMRSPVSLARVVELADRWCIDHPERAPAMAAPIARLAYVVAVDELDDHDFGAAEHHLRLGLGHQPGSLSLRSHLGLALWGSGRRADAIEELRAAVDGCRRSGRLAPLLWILTARALDEEGCFDEARALLEELVPMLPPDERFWELLARVRSRAGAVAAG